MKNLIRAAAALLALAAIALVAVGCADEKTSTATPATPATPTAAPSETAVPTETAAPSETATQAPVDDEIVVEMKDNFFEPKELTIPVNTTVTIVAKNTGTAIHNMHILSTATEGRDFTSDTIVNAGTESRFEVTFTKGGTVAFQCDFHLPDMAGTITVQ